ncbi:MAG: hypothetical protein WBX38_14605 [Candidatus Sulfotelmatobacter sp.]
MEALTQLVTNSLVRHGLDRPVDPRRLQWSHWFRCDSPHSLLIVPSKPGIFALAEEIAGFGKAHGGTDALVRPVAQVGAAALGCPDEQSSADVYRPPTAMGIPTGDSFGVVGSISLQRHDSLAPKLSASVSGEPQRRLLAVFQFSEAEDMAFTLDRTFMRPNPMRDRLAFGKCLLRFVVLKDAAQRRNICTSLTQWMQSSAEKATGLPAGFGLEKALP